MTQPSFLAAGVVDASGFGLNCAVQIDFGTSGAVGVLLQGYVDGGGSAVTIISATVGGTMTGGTAGTNSLGQTTNIGGTISGGTALTLESNVVGVSFLGSAGHARAARGVVALTGLQWVQVRAGLVSDGTPDANGKPTLVCSLYEGVSAIAAGAVFSGLSTAPSQSVTTTANDIAAMAFYASANDTYTASATAPTQQRVRGVSTDAQEYNSFVWDEVGIDGTTTMVGSITGGSTPGYAGTKWVVSGSGAVPDPVITGPTGAAGAGSITHTVNESSNAAGTWTATDSVSWSLTGTDAADLSISGGVVTKASGNFDFETKASYSFNVVNGSATQAVTLNITNLPELSAPTKSTPTSTTAVIGATVDTATGTLYGVLTLDNSPPSGLQVEAGQNSAGSSATTVAATPLTITSTGAKSLAAATVVSGTTRYGWLVLKVGGVYSTVLATGPMYPGTGRPVSDVSVAGWTITGAASAAAALNEDSPGSDSEYITSPALSGSASTASTDLDKLYPAGTYSIKVRASVDTGTGNLVVRLLNGSDVSQGVTANQALTTTPTTYTLSITTTGDATRIRVEVTT